MRISDLVFYEFKRYRKNKKPYQRKTGTEKEMFERRVLEIRYKASRINKKLHEK